MYNLYILIVVQIMMIQISPPPPNIKMFSTRLVVVNVMMSLMSEMSPPPALCNLSVRTAVELLFGVFCFRGELGFLNCDDVCMCAVNKQFELLEFVCESVYVDLQYDEIYLTLTAGSVCLCGVSSLGVVHGLFARLS